MVLLGKHQGMEPLERPRCGWKDNIKINVEEIGCKNKDWIYLAQEGDSYWALAKMVVKIQVP